MGLDGCGESLGLLSEFVYLLSVLPLKVSNFLVTNLCIIARWHSHRLELVEQITCPSQVRVHLGHSGLDGLSLLEITSITQAPLIDHVAVADDL